MIRYFNPKYFYLILSIFEHLENQLGSSGCLIEMNPEYQRNTMIQALIIILSMDSTDIPNEVFQAIFLNPDKLTPATIALIVDWNQTLDPSFNMVKGQFRKFIESNPAHESQFCRDVVTRLIRLAQLKCPRNFIRGYLVTLKSIQQGQGSQGKQILDKQQEQIQGRWQQVDAELLEYYFQAFDLKQRISQNQINQFVEVLIAKKKYNNCLGLIRFLGVAENKTNITKLVGQMSNKRDASKAADYVKSLKLDPKDYPALGERLYKNTARHFLKKEGWEYAEEIFQDYPEALACVVEDLLFKGKVDEARSIWSRHPLWEYLQKQQSRQILEQQLQNKQLPINFLQVNQFGPENREKYLHLGDFGFEQADIVWVDSESPNLAAILQQIALAPMLGIDTESIVGQTKFQKTEGAALIQISTKNKIYLFDGFKSQDPRIAQTFEKCLTTQMIIGHSFSNDTEGMIRAFGIDPRKQVRIKRLVDICKVYKSLYPQSKYSSLAHICKQILGKELCKDQTLTNWRRRPLRRGQIHYAALDAHVVLEVYLEFVKQFGQMVHYYADMDNDSL